MKWFLFAIMMSSIVAQAADTKVTLALNWKPEAEFGGFYTAELMGAYKAAGLDVNIVAGGVGTPVIQMVGAGKVEFGIAAADEVVMARARGSDVVALFAVYQTSPQGIMAHESNPAAKLSDLFKGGTMSLQKGLPFYSFLSKKYGFSRVKIVPYLGGIQQFLTNQSLSSQCFVTSEPIAARKQGVKPKVFLIADSGYNPYTTVLVTRGEFLRKKPEIVKQMLKSVRQGWDRYLKDPGEANARMTKLNPTIDLETLKESAEIQKPLIQTAETSGHGIGSMIASRWKELAAQLKDLHLVDKTLPPERYFQP